MLDGDVFDRKSKAAGFNRYFFNQNSVNEFSSSNSTSESPVHKKTVSAYLGGSRVLDQLNKPLSTKNNNGYSNEKESNNNMPIIVNKEIVTRDIYSISDSYENTVDANYSKINTGFQNFPIETTLIEANDSNINTNTNNFENLYSQIKKPSTQNPSLRNDQALYMNTFYSS